MHVANPASPQHLVLGIDTASDVPSLALLRDGDVFAARAWEARETMSRELLATLHLFLRDAGIERDELDAIAVNVGPGQYGALRVGVATAQGLALALDVSLAGIGRLEAEAFPHLAPGRTVVAVHDAGRSGYAWAACTVDRAGQAPRTLVEPRLDDAPGVVGRAPPGAAWCGEVDDTLRIELSARGWDIKERPPSPEPGAVSVVRLALLHEAFGDPAGVDVVYLRPPPITQPKPAG